MKHTLLLLFLLSGLLSPVLHAQLALDAETVASTTLAPNEEQELQVNVTNNGSEAITVDWARTQTLPNGWYTYVCDKVACFTPETSTGQITMDPGETTFIKLTFGPVSQGTGTVEIELQEVGNASNNVTATFTGTSQTTDLTAINVASVQVYPNPTTNFFMVKHANAIARVEVINLVGRTVRTFEYVDASDKLNVSDLPRGMYLVRMTNKNGQVMTTQRLSKR